MEFIKNLFKKKETTQSVYVTLEKGSKGYELHVKTDAGSHISYRVKNLVADKIKFTWTTDK